MLNSEEIKPDVVLSIVKLLILFIIIENLKFHRYF